MSTEKKPAGKVPLSRWLKPTFTQPEGDAILERVQLRLCEMSNRKEWDQDAWHEAFDILANCRYQVLCEAGQGW